MNASVIGGYEFDWSEPEPLIVLVDDDVELLQGWQLNLARNFPGRAVKAFHTLGEAADALVSLPWPFVMILDHDFPPGTDPNPVSLEQAMIHGSDLAYRLRQSHMWGLMIPICYFSGRLDNPHWLELERTNGGFAPTMYEVKGDRNLSDIVILLDDLFRRAFQAMSEQANRITEWKRQMELPTS